LIFEPGRGQCTGKVTPGYSRLEPEEVAHIHGLLPDACILFSVYGEGPKRDMANRLEGARRALDAGFRAIGLGILLGLGLLEGDLALLLVEEVPGTRLGCSLPRIQEAGRQPACEPQSTIDDEPLTQVFLFLALESPPHT